MVVTLQDRKDDNTKKVIDLEEYIDNLLIKVIEKVPVILQNDKFSCKP